MKTNHQIGLRIVKLPISYLLMTALMFMSLPVNLPAQKPEGDDDLKMAGEKIILDRNIDKNASKMSAQTFTAMKTQAAQNNSGLAKERSAKGVEITYTVLNVEFKTAQARRVVFTDAKASKIKGAWVLTAFGKFADVFVITDAAWLALLNNPNVLRVEYTSQVIAPPPPKVEPAPLQSQAVPENIVRGGYKALTGKNVLIAVIDTGIDFRHLDFISYDSQNRPTSRIKYLWDTATEYQTGRGSIAPFKFPNGTSIGTLYTKDQLTAELRADQQTIPATDLDGHGTACASVAAGNGNADKTTNGLKRKEVEGVAPEAEIIGVRLGYEELDNIYLLNAIVDWLGKAAGTTPLVISGSFGGHYTGHDGQSIPERQLNARFPVPTPQQLKAKIKVGKPGRSIVFAAGNEGNDGIHSKVAFAKQATLVSWNAYKETSINIYFDSSNASIKLSPTQATPLGQDLRVELNPITRQYSASINIKAGVGGIWLENVAGRNTEAHLYFKDRELGKFSPDNISYSHLVGAPGSMENAITVGSFDWNDNFHLGGQIINLTSGCSNGDGSKMPLEIGFLSCYSSPGPNRNGTVKPDIVSPGEWFASANARNGDKSAGSWASPDSTGFYRQMNGTSAATPYTSGVIALMLEKKPALTHGEIKALLKSNASKAGLNPFKDAIPNKNWGYGKLDMAAIDKIFASLGK